MNSTFDCVKCFYSKRSDKHLLACLLQNQATKHSEEIDIFCTVYKP